MSAVSAYVGIGANLDTPALRVRQAFGELGQLPHTRVLACSPLYASAPINAPPQPDFVNAVAHVDTALAPDALLDALLDIEARNGRTRSVRYGPRTLDLDLLLYDQLILCTPRLTIPHPRMHERAFVLRPLVDLAPGIEIPGVGRARTLIQRVSDQSVVRLTPEPPG